MSNSEQALLLRSERVRLEDFWRFGEASPRMGQQLLVAQVSKPAVSPISKSAGRATLCDARVWKPAIQQTWKSALRRYDQHTTAGADPVGLSLHRSAHGTQSLAMCHGSFIGCFRRTVTLASALVLAGAVFPALVSAAPSYVVRTWQTGDGLPANNVTAVVQTRDGYLWIGTRNGLARFDGARFYAFDNSNTPQLQSPHVTCLFEAADGALWIGHETGEVTCYREGKFRAVPVQAAWRSTKILAIAADAAGDIWLLNKYGDLVRLKDGVVLASPRGSATHLVSIARNPKGGFWIQRDTEVLVLDNGELKPLPFDEPATNRYVQGICATHDGGLWVMIQNRMRKWDGHTWTEDIGSAPWGLSSVHTLIETKDKRLVAATVNFGLYLVFPGQGARQFSRTNGLASDWVTSLCEDREGNLWAGMANGGLAVLRTVNVTTPSPTDRWQGRAVLSVLAGSDGALWAGTEGAGLYRFKNGEWLRFGNDTGLASSFIWSVGEDAQGRIWAGTWGAGLFVRERDRFEPPAGLEITVPTPALFFDRRGGLWIGTGVGLLHVEAGRTNWIGRNGELTLPDVRAVKEASDGQIWFGMSGGGLGSFKDGTLRQYRRADGISSDFVQCLHVETNGTLWIGTFGGGVNRLKDGRFTSIGRKQGLPNDVICDIQDDGAGFFWISSHGGIFRVSKAELNRCADGATERLHCLTYGLSDGLPALECSGGLQPAGCRTADGRLWFPTVKGLVALDPNNVKTNQLPPPVVIEELRVDGHTVTNDIAHGRTLQIAPGRHRLEFDYTGLSFVAPERVRFKFRLEGLETEWVEASARRTAIYSFVPPGDYVFRVIACNNDGVWNETGAMLMFTVLPHFWQTLWFRVLVWVTIIAASGGFVWLDMRRRIRRKLERLERQRALEQERARIAHDIHDDLGAHLTRITMLSESARAELDPASGSAADLDEIYDTAREVTKAMDEIVWAVNPKHDTLESLGSYLEKFALDLLTTADIRCRLDMPRQYPSWPLTSEVRHNLFLAFKEALHNVVKHARATEVRVSLALKTGSFELSVDDNGCGFEVGAGANAASQSSDRIESGNGLENMARRLAEIGGQCDIRSAPGQGTKVTFVIPLKTQVV